MIKDAASSSEADSLALLVKERETTCALLEEWMAQQKAIVLEHTTKQERFLQHMLDAHRATLKGLRNESRPGDLVHLPAVSPLRTASGDASSTPGTPRDTAGQEVVAGVNVGTKENQQVVSAVNVCTEKGPGDAGKAATPNLAEQLETLDKYDGIMSWWRRTSGLQTVEKWVSNYRKHPAGWAALLMIQGIPEVTGRLRSKVENYAIYSALFLSMSIALLTDPPNFVTDPCPEQDLSNIDWWLCHFRLRAYLYGFAVGTAAHMLSILQAMAFVNALNETARDSDVYRMFARGKGFIATVKCQLSFRVGCCADFLAVIIAVSYHIGWEAILGGLLLIFITLRKRKQTSDLLFNSCSIVKYWREELGGKPDNDDPYDLQIPVGVFKEYSQANRKLFSCADLPSADSALWASISKSNVGHIPKHDTAKGEHHSPGMNHTQSAAVAALF